MQKRLLWTILVLVVFGLVILSSAGVIEGQKRFDSPYYYVKHQILLGVLPGLALMFIFSRIDYRFWRKLAFPILFVALTLLILVLLPSVGLALKGARSWIAFKGFTFQPAETLKFALIIYLAAWFGIKEGRIKHWTYGALPFIVVMALVGLLLALQPDVGTLGIVIAIAAGVYFVAGAPVKHIAIVVALALVAISAFVMTSTYRLDRIKAALNPVNDPRDSSYQLNQSLIAIGSGGMLGVGFGHSRQKLGFLPETIGDSIFPIIAEELGFVGATATVGLFVLLAIFLTQTARNAPDKFGQLLVTGMEIWIMTQAFINIGGATGIIPLTGLPLPFISYGGTALVALLGGLGIVLNIAKRV